MRSTRIKWVIALAVAVSGIWFMGVMYVLTYNPEVYVNPGIVGSNLPSVSAPVMKPITTYTPSRMRGTYRPVHYGTSRVQRPSSLPMQSMRIRTTSSAEVHSVGGGGNGGGYSSGGSSQRGIVYSTASVAMPQTNFIAMASTRQMAAPEATEAPSMAKLASGPRRAPGPPNPGGGGDLPGEHQLTEQPVGDAVLPLMMLLTLYCAVRVYRRKRSV